MKLVKILFFLTLSICVMISFYRDRVAVRLSTELTPENKINVVRVRNTPNVTSIFEAKSTQKKTIPFYNLELHSVCRNETLNVTKLKENKDENINEKCRYLPLPMTAMSTKNSNTTECMPTFVLLPSFPTSGNELFTNLFRSHTGLATGAVYRVEGGGNPQVYQFQRRSPFFVSEKFVCEANIKLPHSGQSAVLKSHNEFVSHYQKNALKEKPSFIIRLARNPGDHLLRNKARWLTHGRNNDNFAQFSARAKKVCEELLVDAGWSGFRWGRFHKSYREGTKKHNISSIVFKYEHMTDVNYVGKRMREVLDFIGEEYMYSLNYSEILKPFSYRQGTLFKEFCGIDMARELHNITRVESEALGYSFDYDEGVWNVAD